MPKSRHFVPHKGTGTEGTVSAFFLDLDTFLRIRARLTWQRKCTVRRKQMSANPLELVMARAVNPSAAPAAHASERRKRSRIGVHWPVLLFRNSAPEAVGTVTTDLSSSGFHCSTQIRFEPGESLRCTIKIPSHDPNGKHLERNLDCSVRVVRVERKALGADYGVACHIDDYHVADLLCKACRAE